MRVVVCHHGPDLEGEPVYLVTGRLYWEEKRVVECYGLRFRIDAFYRDIEQNLGLEGYNLRSLRGTRRHWELGFLGYSLSGLGSAGADCIRGFSPIRPSGRSAGGLS